MSDFREGRSSVMRQFRTEILAVTQDSPALVVPEIGINHGGSIDTALKMADAAVLAGARLIKHQTHIPDEEMSEEAHHVIPGNDPRSIYDIISECSLSEADEARLANHVREAGVVFFSTPFSLAAVDRLEALGVPFYKVGSGECGNFPLLERIASTKKPVILSTGMQSMQTIKAAVSILQDSGEDVAILQATNLYPTPPHVLNLSAINDLKEQFPKHLVGYSDHTTSNVAAIAAIALGARIVERHFTDSFSRKGPDISCSMDPQDLKELIEASELLSEALPGGKEFNEEEEVTRRFAFASLVATREINVGEMLDETNTVLKRPAGGDFDSENRQEAYGKRAGAKIPPNVQIRAAWLETP